jgi:hypothetical protein
MPIMLPLCDHPYKRVSTNDDDDASNHPTTPLKIGSILIGSLALVAISYTLAASAAEVIANQSPPRPSFSDVRSTFLEVSTVESPYERHWPNSHLPHWATKKINFNVHQEQQICFTHVGKAGGSTIGCSLGFSLHCHGDESENGDYDAAQMKQLSSSLLAKLTTHAFHKNVYNCDDDSGYFLFVIRDPIDRAKSAFNYDRPGGKRENRKSHFYFDCPFYRMEDFVQNGLREEGEASDRCKRWALDAIQGIDESYASPSHWFYNYQYYYEAIPSDSKILAIRNEHIVEDIREVEDVFGCHEQERLELTKSMNINTQSDQADFYLSDESTPALCQALCNEIQVYKKILRQALNLSQDQLRVSLTELEAKCPNEAIAEECTHAMPDIREKLRLNRGY